MRLSGLGGSYILDGVSAMRWHPDSRRLLSWKTGYTSINVEGDVLRVDDVVAGEQIGALNGYFDAVIDARWSGDGESVLYLAYTLGAPDPEKQGYVIEIDRSGGRSFSYQDDGRDLSTTLLAAGYQVMMHLLTHRIPPGMHSPIGNRMIRMIPCILVDPNNYWIDGCRKLASQAAITPRSMAEV
jgi:hypothetical protein